MIADIREWLAVPSVQADPLPGKPFGENVARALDVALATGSKYGFETRNIDYYAGDISMGSGEQTMGMLAHLDIVPVGEGWTHDPFAGEIEDGKLFGRGAIDDKGPALVALHAMRAVRDAGIPLKDGVRLILGCDEETGMSDMRYYASKLKMPDYGFSPDAMFPVINIEKGGVNVEIAWEGKAEADIPVVELYAGERPNVVPAFAKAIVGSEKVCFAEIEKKVFDYAEKSGRKLAVKYLGDNKVEISAEGVLSHAAWPEGGVNAAGVLLIALKEMGMGANIQPALDMANACIGMEYDGASLGIKRDDELSHELTCNLGILRWNGEKFSATLDIRYPLNITEEEIMENIGRAVAPYGCCANRIGGHTPLHVPQEHKIVRGLMQVYNELTNSDLKPLAIGGGTYSRMMPNTVAFGIVFPDQEDCCHIADEHIEIDRMMEAVRIYAHAIAELASGNIE
ncbi:MAG: dipeptidase PepV [Clostridia bacterium]|nr:dipeptidase PepV [Clostridia bacterium]